jgi:hypothetical protein
MQLYLICDLHDRRCMHGTPTANKTPVEPETNLGKNNGIQDYDTPIWLTLALPYHTPASLYDVLFLEFLHLGDLQDCASPKYPAFFCFSSRGSIPFCPKRTPGIRPRFLFNKNYPSR